MSESLREHNLRMHAEWGRDRTPFFESQRAVAWCDEAERELVALRARVAELEAALRRCQVHSSPTERERIADLALTRTPSQAGARLVALEAVAVEARKRADEAVPQWAPELRAALARLKDLS